MRICTHPGRGGLVVHHASGEPATIARGPLAGRIAFRDPIHERRRPSRLAYAYEDRGDYAPALAEVERALQAEPDLAEAHNLRGLLLEELDRNDEALVAYRMAVQIDPSFAEAAENLNSLEEELRPPKEAHPQQEIKVPRQGG